MITFDIFKNLQNATPTKVKCGVIQYGRSSKERVCFNMMVDCPEEIIKICTTCDTSRPTSHSRRSTVLKHHAVFVGVACSEISDDKNINKFSKYLP